MKDANETAAYRPNFTHSSGWALPRRRTALQAFGGFGFGAVAAVAIVMALVVISPPPVSPIGYETAVALLTAASLAVVAALAAIVWRRFRG